MSYIHQQTLLVMRQDGFSDAGYCSARRVVCLRVVREALQSAVESVRAQNGDYKDFAANVSALIPSFWAVHDRMSRMYFADLATEFDLLNGYSCPRAFHEGMRRIKVW